jgi:hypothetical protein
MINFILRAQVFYTDGSSSAKQSPLGQTSNLALREIVTYPVGFQSLGLHLLHPEKTPDYYEVWLNNGNGTLIAEKRRFYLRDHEYNEVELWFQNSYGVPESVVLRSGTAEGIKIEKEQFQKNLPFQIDITKHRIASGDVRNQETIEVSTGYLSIKELKPYIDLLISPRVWMIKNAQRIPVMIPQGEYQVVQESESEGAYEYAFNIKLIKSFTNQAFSNTHG